MCYEKNIKDKQGRNILLKIDDDYFLRAFHENKEIGVFDYHYTECEYGMKDFYTLWGMNIINDYQNNGIGTEMIKFGNEFLGSVVYPSPFETDRNANHLSSEGLALLQSCVNKNIIYNVFDDYNEEE